MPRGTLTLEQRFWSKVRRTDLCWLWEAGLDRDGYGRFQSDLAHRVAYTLKVGPIPEGMQIDHLCRIRRCVNPDHLDIVTSVENTRRSAFATRPTCLYGHPLDGMTSRGHRYCKACYRERQRRINREQRGLAEGQHEGYPARIIGAGFRGRCWGCEWDGPVRSTSPEAAKDARAHEARHLAEARERGER